MIWAIVFYAIFVNAVAFLVKRHGTGDEYLMGGRNYSPLYVAFGIFTLIGGGELIAVTALGYTYGWPASGYFLGYAICFVVMAALCGRMRGAYQKTLPLSLSDYAHENFGAVSGYIISFLTVLIFWGLLVMQYAAAGNLIGPLTGLDYMQAVLVAALISLSYLVIGGFRTVMATDLLQGFAMLAILPILILVLVQTTSIGEPSPPALVQVDIWTWITFIVPGLLGGLASSDVWQRIYAAPSDQFARRGLLIGAVLFILFGAMLAGLGIVAHQLGFASADTAFADVLSQGLPLWAAFMAVIFVLAVILSTADTEMFLLTGIVEREFLRLGFHSSGSDLANRESIGRSKLWLLSVTGCALVAALFFGDLVQLYGWLLSLGLIIAPIIGVSLFVQLPRWLVLIALIANAVAFAVVAFLGLLSIENAFLVSLPSLVILAPLSALMYRPKLGHHR